MSSAYLSLLGAGGRALLFWRSSQTTTSPSDTFSSLVFHTSFAILRLVFLWLVTSVLLRNYRRARAELYRPAVDLQDYEMVELFLRRLKMWMGLSRAKEVHLQFYIQQLWLAQGGDPLHFLLFIIKKSLLVLLLICFSLLSFDIKCVLRAWSCHHPVHPPPVIVSPSACHRWTVLTPLPPPTVWMLAPKPHGARPPPAPAV